MEPLCPIDGQALFDPEMFQEALALSSGSFNLGARWYCLLPYIEPPKRQRKAGRAEPKVSDHLAEFFLIEP